MLWSGPARSRKHHRPGRWFYLLLVGAGFGDLSASRACRFRSHLRGFRAGNARDELGEDCSGTFCPLVIRLLLGKSRVLFLRHLSL